MEGVVAAPPDIKPEGDDVKPDDDAMADANAAPEVPAEPEVMSETLYIQNLNERIKIDG